jgi:polysaccharide pyruvyl transferase WcaK-like protein
MPSAVVINDTRVDQHHGCNRVMCAILDLAAANGVDIIGMAPAHRDWRSDASFTARFERSEIVIVNGEGTIHHSRPAAIPLLAAGARAKDLGKKCVLLNFSWFANDSAMERALQDFDILSARESMSQEAVRTVRPDCRLVPDLSFYGPTVDGKSRDGIGFGDSVNAADSMALHRLRKRFDGTFVPIVTPKPGLGGKLRLVRYFLSNHGASDRRPLGFRIAQAYEHIREGRRDQGDYLSLLSRLRLLMTGRFHGMTLALCAGTPVLAVPSNTPKIEAVMSDVGLGAWRMVGPDEIDEKLIEKASAWHGDEREKGSRYIGMAAEEANRLFRDVRALGAA